MSGQPYESQVVYITCRQLRLRSAASTPGFGLTYHAPNHDAYEFATRCGMVYTDPRDRRSVLLSGMRRDTADLIADPCQRCFP